MLRPLGAFTRVRDAKENERMENIREDEDLRKYIL
jgi:hypothetical protein